MNDIEKLSNRTAELALQTQVSAIDPLTIMMIIQAVMAVIDALKKCGYLSTNIEKTILKPNWLNRFRMKRIVSKHIKDAKLAQAVTDALPIAASELSESEVVGLLGA